MRIVVRRGASLVLIQERRRSYSSEGGGRRVRRRDKGETRVESKVGVYSNFGLNKKYRENMELRKPE